MSRVFIKDSAPEFELEPGKCFELLRPLYGLTDAGDFWHKTLRHHLTADLGLQPTKADSSLYFSFRKGELLEINGSYFDDLLWAGGSELQEEPFRTPKRFETSGGEPLPFFFADFDIDRSPNESLSINQVFDLKKLEEMNRQLSGLRDFRSMLMKVAYTSNTKPDLQFEISELVQITQKHFDDNTNACIKKLNHAVRYTLSECRDYAFPKTRQTKRTHFWILWRHIRS